MEERRKKEEEETGVPMKAYNPCGWRFAPWQGGLKNIHVQARNSTNCPLFLGVPFHFLPP